MVKSKLYIFILKAVLDSKHVEKLGQLLTFAFKMKSELHHCCLWENLDVHEARSPLPALVMAFGVFPFGCSL